MSPNESDPQTEAPEQNAAQELPGDQQALAAESQPSANAPESASEGGSTSATSTESKVASGGPISLERIRQLRMSQQKIVTPKFAKRPNSSGPKAAETGKRGASGGPLAKRSSDDGQGASVEDDDSPTVSSTSGAAQAPNTASRIAVPSRRQPLSKDLEDALMEAMGEADLDKLLVGDSMLRVGQILEEGQRMQGKVMKTHGEFVFVSLGGPNEGVIPALQFEELPAEGTQLDVIVRAFLPQEGLYELSMPGNAVDVADWSDINEGEVIEVVVTAANAGGLECKAGHIRGFIPASQVAEYRVENLTDFVDQKVLCVITEANQRRGNLVLSRRAVLEREKTEKRAERLANLEVGAAVEGTVRKITDFGAFVDIGGLDGLLHISQLSWERVKHPSEVLEEGQTVQVRVDKVDPQTGKIGLSYRSLQEHPWAGIESRFPVGTIAKGTVTRIADFGAFVRLATGVEGLVHVSELAHHRVQRVENVVSEGQEVEVKVLSCELEKQRISLSIKAAVNAPEPAAEATETEVEETPPPKPVLPKHQGPLKGGTGGPSGGDQFGLKW